MLQRYRPILGVRSLRRLLVASVIGRLPLGTCSLAVLLLVRADTHSYATAGVSVGAIALAQAVFAPLCGRWLDRVGPGPVVAASALVETAALAALAAVAGPHRPALVFVLLSAWIGAAMPPVASASRVLWHGLMDGADARDAAFSLDAIGQEFVWMAGPVLVGTVTAAVSARAAVLMVAAITAGTSACFLVAVRSLGQMSSGAVGSDDTEPTSSFTHRLASVTCLMGVGLGGTEVAMPALAGRVHHPALSGVLLAVWSVGSMVGGIAVGLRPWRLAPERRLTVLLSVGGLLIVPAMLSGTLAAALVSAFIAGVCIAPIFSCTSALIARHAAPDAMARAFTLNTAALVAGAAAGSALSGVIVSRVGVGVAFGLAGAVGLLAAVTSFALLGERPVPGTPGSPLAGQRARRRRRRIEPVITR